MSAILLDLSGSMSGAGVAILRTALGDLLKQRPGAHLIAFACTAKKITLGDLDTAPPLLCRISHITGGGNGTTGIEIAIPLQPERSVLISDGGIYCECSAATEFPKVDALTGSLSTIKVGGGLAFRTEMMELARRGGGKYLEWDGRDPRRLTDLIIHAGPRIEVKHHEPGFRRIGQPTKTTVRVGSSPLQSANDIAAKFRR